MTGNANSPYITYIENRPIKIAFIINPRNKKFKKHLDAVVSYNQNVWGGRYNPIILTDGKTIKEDWWKILVEHDPDFIISIGKTSNEIIGKIENLLSPLELIEIDNKTIERHNGLVSYLMPKPLPIMPTKHNLNELSSPYIENPTYIDFDSRGSKNTILKRFVNYNFGDNIYLRIHILNTPLSNIKSYKIDDTYSLCKALEDLYTLRNDEIIYPIQLCSLPNYFPNVDSDTIYDRFTITVGDSAYETAYHWNRCLHNAKHKRTRINEIWLPLSLAKNTKLQAGLRQWLKTVVDTHGISAYKVQLVSFTLTNQELQNLANNLAIQGYSFDVEVYDRVQLPSFWRLPPFSNISKIKDFYSTHSKEINISIEQPSINGVDVGGQWMTDLNIKLSTEFRNIIGRYYWLQLPRKNNIVDQLVEGKQTRINSLGIPSTLLATNDSIIKIRIPYDSILYKLFIEPNYPWSQSDLRYKTAIISKKYFDYKISDKGMYLEGFLNFFHDLSEAYMNLTISFWRYVFYKLSKGASRNNKYIRDKIQKQIRRNNITSLGDGQGLDLLVDLVLREAEIVKQYEDIVEIKNFTKYLVDKYKQDIEQVDSWEKHYLEKKNITNYISQLLKRNILLMGVRPICQTCGSTFWYHIDETKQSLRCAGCQNNIGISVEEKWYYKLNNLFKISVNQGTIPL